MILSGVMSSTYKQKDIFNPFIYFLFTCYVFVIYDNLLDQEITHLLLVTDVDVLIIMVTNESQAENVLYGENGAVSGAYNILLPILRCLFNYILIYFLQYVALPAGASIILSSTVSPAYVSQLEHRLHGMLLLQ